MVSLKEIEKICQKEKIGRFDNQSLLQKSYIIHRHIAKYISYIILNFLPRITPNQISVAMVGISIAGGGLLLSTQYWLNYSGIGLIYFSFLLDKVDGDVARYKKEYSNYGKYLDEMYHFISQPLIYLALGIKGSFQTQSNSIVIIAFLTYLLCIINRFTPKISQLIVHENNKKITRSDKLFREADNKKSLLYLLIDNCLIIIRYDFVIASAFLILIFAQCIYETKGAVMFFLLINSSCHILRFIIINRSIFQKLK